MSSRALRNLQRERDSKLIAPHTDTTEQDCDEVTCESDSGALAEVNETDTFTRVKAANLFDLLNEGSPDEVSLDKNDCEEAQSNMSRKIKKKKKKKNKDLKTNNNTDCSRLTDEDDIDASVRAVNEILGSVAHPVSAANPESIHNGSETSSKSLLFIEHRCLNPDNEVRKLFGTRVMQMDQNHKRHRNKHRAKNSYLSRPRDDWQIHKKTGPIETEEGWYSSSSHSDCNFDGQFTVDNGLSMKLVESSASGVMHFAFEHSKFYQRIQFEFLNAVESLEPQNVVNLCNEYPFHVDTLLQVSEICKMSEDRQAAIEMIERALFVCENSFHPLFSLTQGTSRLDYKIAENRSFFLALWRNMISIGRKGCYRTALEFGKLILSLDPDVDPLCIILTIDFYALRSDHYSYLIRMYAEWESHRNLSQLPNFAFSVPLAMFHQANNDRRGLQPADAKLQTALLMFPGLLMPLIEKCGIVVDGDVLKCDYFKKPDHEPESLKQLEMLYVGRCESCWKEPDVMAWLEKNVRAIVERLGKGAIDNTLLDQYANYRQTRYRRTPRNICRHIVLSDVKEATASLPREITLSPILSYDPLPPLESVSAYTRPARPTRAQQNSNPLSMFFRSLAPSFNPMEPAAQDDGNDEEGAAGGANVRQSAAALMDVMRDLLQNLRFVPPPVENNGVEGRNDDDSDDADWEN